MNPAAPNTFVYLNKVPVASFHVDLDSGPFGREGSADAPGRVLLYRLERGGPGDGFVGTMRFDNFITANESLFAGDVNSDGTVNIFDINLVSSHWNETGDPENPGPGDANRDGLVNIFDINLISANWSTGAPMPPPPGNSTAVPEPSTWVLVSLGLAALLAVGGNRIGR